MFQSSFQTKISLFLSIHKKHFMRFYCVKNMKVCHSSFLNDLCHLHKIWELHKNAHCTMMHFFHFLSGHLLCVCFLFLWKTKKNCTLDSGSNIPHTIKVHSLNFIFSINFAHIFAQSCRSGHFWKIQFFQKLLNIALCLFRMK